MPIANLHLDAQLAPERQGIIDQADSIRDQARRIEFLAPTGHDLARHGPNLADVQPLAAGDTEAAPLSYRESMHARVSGEASSAAVDNRSGAELRGIALPLDKPRVIAVGNEADFLALRLVRGGKAQCARTGANFGLGHGAKRKNRAREFVLPEREKKIRLILGVVGGAQQMESAVGALLDSGVMSGRDIVGRKRAGAAPQAIEFDLPIAHHTRIWRAPAQIFGDEIIDHARGEVGAQINHVERKIHPLRHPARIFEVVMRAAGAAALRHRRRRLGRKPHRDAYHVVAILAQEGSRDRAVHPTRHSNQHSRPHRALTSDRGSAAATRRHTAGMIAATASISSAVLFLPRLILSELRASATLRPIARNTCDGSTAPAAHAEPIETSTPSRSSATSMLSPSTPGNVRLSVFGSLPTIGPFKRRPGIASRSCSNSDAASEPIRSDSGRIAFIAASAAAPNATAPSRFGVP